MTNFNIYNEASMDSSDLKGQLLDKNMITNNNMHFGEYIAGPVQKSNSLNSNECSTSQSSMEESQLVRSSPGLKLVFKRQPGNLYEVKTQQLNVLDDNNNIMPTLKETSSYLPTPPHESDSCKRRPKRLASRKVKFVFSDEENEEDLPLPVKRKNIEKSYPPGLLKTNQHSQFACQYRDINSDESDNDCGQLNFDPVYREILLKNILSMRGLSQSYTNLPNNILNQTDISNRNTKKLDVKTKSKVKQTRNKIKNKKIPTKKLSNENKKVNRSIEYEPDEMLQKPKYRQSKEDIAFQPSEIVRSTLFEKMDIINNQPCVLINHSVPMPVALVEDKTNIVQTKAVLFIHLFQSISSPCIGCPLCKKFLTISEFSKHVHLDEDEEDDENEVINSKKSYKILPYRINNESELSETDLSTWKLFGKRYNDFKRAQPKLSENKTEKTDALPEKKAVLSEQSPNENATIKSVIEKLNLKKIEFNDWDYKENQNYLLSKERFDSEQVYVVNNNLVENENTHYFMENKEDLFLSEDETEDLEDNEQAKTNLVEDEKSDAESQEKIIQDLLQNIISSVEQNILKSSEPNETVKFNHKNKSLVSKPSILQRYFNLYDNLTSDMLIYICENEFTIIPDSYIMYMNHKRLINTQKLNLSTSDYHQTKWLQLTLNLES